MKEHKFKFDTFIGGWYIPENVCDEILDYFKKETNKHYGTVENSKVGSIVDKNQKESIDMIIKPTNTYFNNYFTSLKECVTLYAKRYEQLQGYQPFGLKENFNIQYYPPGGGYKTYHCERPVNNSRVLVFMTYLNTAKNAGTEFKYYNLKTQAKKGLTLIWPTDFTHTHKGVISKKDEKHIVTGWLTFY